MELSRKREFTEAELLVIREAIEDLRALRARIIGNEWSLEDTETLDMPSPYSN